jgi:hypothetical protein
LQKLGKIGGERIIAHICVDCDVHVNCKSALNLTYTALASATRHSVTVT